MRHNKQRKSSSSSNGALPALPLLPETLLRTVMVLENVVITPATETAPSLGDELQLPYVGHVAAASAISPLPQIEAADFDYSNDPIFQALFNTAENDVLAALALTSDAHVGTETVADVANTEGSQSVAEVEDSVILPSVTIPDVATTFNDNDSADEFQEPKKSKLLLSSKDKAKAKVTQMGIGSSSKRPAPKKHTKVVEAVATPSTSASSCMHQVAGPSTGNDGAPILRKILGKRTLPALKCTSEPKKVLGCNKEQVKRSPKSVIPAGNTAVRPRSPGSVLPAQTVATTPILHATESDEESEVFSQNTGNVINAFYLLRTRVQEEYSVDLANVQSSEDELRRADEALRLAQEARRVASETLARHRRALDKSSKKLRQIDRK